MEYAYSRNAMLQYVQLLYVFRVLKVRDTLYLRWYLRAKYFYLTFSTRKIGIWNPEVANKKEEEWMRVT